jgi:glycosyltransferase involved in cell wall biosynthesis
VPVRPLSLHPHYRPLTRLALNEQWNGLSVQRPRFAVWPVIGARHAARSLAKAVLPRLRSLRRDLRLLRDRRRNFWPTASRHAPLARGLVSPFSIKARGSAIYHLGACPCIGEQIARLLQAADGLLAVSQSRLSRRWPRAACRPTRSRCTIRASTALFQPLDRGAAKARLGVSGPLLATVGALIERKGQAFAIDAMGAAAGRDLLLAGSGPDRAPLEQQAARLGVMQRVRFLGSQPPEEVARMVAAADVMLLPTRAEGIANAWVEALACGTPVVTCEAGGVRDVIDRPELGRVVARDGESLAGAVRELLAAPPAAEDVRKGALRFSWERNAQELEAHLAQVARAFGSRSRSDDT